MPIAVRYTWLALGLACYCLPHSLWGQGKIKVFYERTEELQDCRIQLEDLRPVLADDNPFIRAHRWDAAKLTERAETGPGRELVIEQFGCLRYHQKLTLNVERSSLRGEINPSLFLHELLEVLRIVNYGNEEYRTYRNQLEALLIEKLKTLPYKTRINFPLSEFNIFLEIDANEKRLTTQMEFVRFVHTEKVNLPGIKEHLDDGYHEGSLR